MTFREYVKQRRQTHHSFAADFTYDAKRDPTFPDVATWAELETYLAQCHACDNAYIGARAVWRQYQRCAK